MRHLCSISALCLLLATAARSEEDSSFRAGFARDRDELTLVIEAGEKRLSIRTVDWGFYAPRVGRKDPGWGSAYDVALASMCPAEIRFGRVSLRGLLRNTRDPSGPVDDALFVFQVVAEGREILLLGLSAALGETDLADLRKALAECQAVLVWQGAAADLVPAESVGSFGSAAARRIRKALESARPLSPAIRVTKTGGIPVLDDVGFVQHHLLYTHGCLATRRDSALRHGLADVVLLGPAMPPSGRDLKDPLPPPRWPREVTVESLAPPGLRAKYRIDRVWLDSEKPSGYPANDHFPVEHYVPPGEARGAIIVLPIWRGGVLLAERVVAAHLAKRGYQAAIMPLPWQFQRAPEGVSSGSWTVSSDLERTRKAMVQALSDVETLATWLRSKGNGVGVLGISLGAHVAAGAYRMNPRFRAGVFVMAGGDPASMIWAASKETRGIKRDLVARGVTLEQARELLSPLDPAKAGGDWPFPGFPRYRGVLMINGTEDTVIPPKNARILHAAMGEPEILWLPVNHYSMATRIKEILERTDKHLDSLFE